MSQDPKIGTTLAHYELVAKLGSGGMGDVYRARDGKLGRDVALKVLPPALAADPDRRRRFEQEARAIASLRHPNIVIIHSVEEAGGTPFLTMECVEGSTLDAAIPDWGLPLARFFELAISIADALAAAHAKGITHRDLKPANVMLDEDGRVKVLDFGLAKLTEVASGPGADDPDAATIADQAPATEAGQILGTVAYMSPEQAEGKPIDHRSDLFSLGVLFYEMTTGRRPFTGDSTASTIAAILRDQPAPVSDLRGEVPRHLSRIINRCLDKEPARRFQSAADLRVELENLRTETATTEIRSASSIGPSPAAPSAVTPPSDAPSATTPSTDAGSAPSPSRRGLAPVLLIYPLVAIAIVLAVRALARAVGLPDWVTPLSIVLLAIGFPILLATAIAQRRGDASRWFTWRRALAGGVLAFAALGIGIAGFFVTRHLGIGPAASLVSAGVLDADDSVLIADFENQTDDPTLGEAMKEAFSIDLSRSPVVKVVPSGEITEVLRLMGRPANTPLDLDTAREVAMRDGVKAVVAGQVSRTGGGYVLSARVIQAETGAALAAERAVARGDDDLIGAIDELSQKLRERIGESLKSARSGEPLAHVTTRSLPALRKYSQAIQLEDEGDAERAIPLLEEAVAADSTFAMAYRKLAVLLGNTFQARDRRLAAITRAYELRDRLSERERYLTIAYYHSEVTGDDEKIIQAYEQVLDLDPDDSWALNNLGLVYGRLGNPEVALGLFERAAEHGPSTTSLGNLARAQMSLRRFGAADSTIARMTSVFPEADTLFFAVYRALLDLDYEAIETVARDAYAGSRTGSERRGVTWYLYASHATRGKHEDAARYRRELEEMREGSDRLALPIDRAIREAFSSALASALVVGDPDASLDALNGALRTTPIDSVPEPNRPYLNLATAFAMLGDPNTARLYVERYEEAKSAGRIQADRSEDGVLGWIAIADGTPMEAIPHFRAWLRAAPGSARRLWNLAAGFDHADMPDSALARYEQYLSATNIFRVGLDHFTLPATLRRVGELHELRGDRERAIQRYVQLLDLWKDADPELRARLEPVKARVKMLRDG